jgi:hypothetical protein
MRMLEVILAIVVTLLAFFDLVLWQAVATYRNRFLLAIAVLLGGIDLILLTLPGLS